MSLVPLHGKHKGHIHLQPCGCSCRTKQPNMNTFKHIQTHHPASRLASSLPAGRDYDNNDVNSLASIQAAAFTDYRQTHGFQIKQCSGKRASKVGRGEVGLTIKIEFINKLGSVKFLPFVFRGNSQRTENQ